MVLLLGSQQPDTMVSLSVSSVCAGEEAMKFTLIFGNFFHHILYLQLKLQSLKCNYYFLFDHPYKNTGMCTFMEGEYIALEERGCEKSHQQFMPFPSPLEGSAPFVTHVTLTLLLHCARCLGLAYRVLKN